MSATGRSPVRVESDFYATPAWCVYRLLEAVALPLSGDWLDPCAGDGAILRATASFESLAHTPLTGPKAWTTVEIRPECESDLHKSGASRIIIGDFLELAKRTTKHWNVILTNPPYSLAMPFVLASLERADVVAMLLRLNWLASEKRANWMREYTPDVYVLPNRPSFTGGGTDATEYCFCIWGMGGGKLRILQSTSKAERLGSNGRLRHEASGRHK